MRLVAIGSAVLGVLLAGEAVVLALKWPFTRNSVVQSLSEEANGEVTIGKFRQTFFPAPGCIMDAVVIHRGSDAHTPPIISVDRVTIEGSYGALLVFSKHLERAETQGMRIHIERGGDAERGGPRRNDSRASTSIGRFVAENTVLEFAPKTAGDSPYILQIHRVLLSPASESAAMSFEASLAIPRPAGEVTAKGSFGPWQKGNAFQTPVSGSYRFEHADLGKFSGIAGMLGSSGNFSGQIASIDVRGNADVPDFEIVGTSHRVHLATSFRATVDGQTGDVRLSSVQARFLHTEVGSEGMVASPVPGSPKTVALNVSVASGRIQDLLRLVTSGPPGLNGIVNLRFQVELPAGDKPFLQRLKLTGQIGVGDARFTKPETQQGLERISANATPDQVVNPADVVSDVRGRVTTANGVTTLTALSFRVPGASAELGGTYQLMTHRLDLRGTVRLEEKVSQTTTGVKSFLLKALDPFFRKRKQGPVVSVVPIRISGTNGNISIGLN